MYLALQVGLRKACRCFRMSKNLLTSSALMYINLTGTPNTYLHASCYSFDPRDSDGWDFFFKHTYVFGLDTHFFFFVTDFALLHTDIIDAALQSLPPPPSVHYRSESQRGVFRVYYFVYRSCHCQQLDLTPKNICMI